jgi:hypothetical protein
MFKFSKKGQIEDIEESKVKIQVYKEMDLEIPSPPPEICKPKVRVCAKPQRPPSSGIETSGIRKNSDSVRNNTSSKTTRRLRSLVNDHRDVPM